MATYTYVAAGTRVVVEDSAGNTRWHNTRNELHVDGAVSATCPTRGVNVFCLESMGFKVYFTESQIKFRCTTAEEYIGSNRPCLFMYDIPSDADIYNPSSELRRYAIRLNKSCWLTMEPELPMLLLNELTEAGTDWHTVPVDPRGVGDLVSQAIRATRRELDSMIDRSAHALDRAINRLEATNEGESPEETEKKYVAHTKLIRKRMETLYGDLENILTRFHIDPDAVNLSNARVAVDGLDKVIRTRLEIFKTSVTTLREQGRDDIADALEGGTMPALIAADAMDEADEGSGESLRDAFDN